MSLLQATARRLCKLDAECFGVTLEGLWAERAESYLIDAQEVVEATGAGELLEALQAAVSALVQFSALATDAHVIHFYPGLPGIEARARAAIEKATA